MLIEDNSLVLFQGDSITDAGRDREEQAPPNPLSTCFLQADNTNAGEFQTMIEYELDKLETTTAPPTREAIDQVRQSQLESLKALRRKLLAVVDHQKSVA